MSVVEDCEPPVGRSANGHQMTFSAAKVLHLALRITAWASNRAERGGGLRRHSDRPAYGRYILASAGWLNAD